MIEIRVDEDDDRPVTPDGPHDRERTRAVAEGIDAACRLLNYATSPEKHGLAYASDVYSVLGSLSAAVNKLPQALNQMIQFINVQVVEGTVRENPHYGKHNGDAEAAYAAMLGALRNAVGAAGDLERWLCEGRSAISGLESTVEDDQ